jgi:hypothetical protein
MAKGSAAEDIGPPMPTLDEIWECYSRLQSLRGAGKELGMGHMAIRNRLSKAGYELQKRDPSMEALNPRDKAYLRPSQIEKIDMLAAEEGRTRHEMARILMDEALDARDAYLS